jgi:hypothetical protein
VLDVYVDEIEVLFLERTTFALALVSLQQTP